MAMLTSRQRLLKIRKLYKYIVMSWNVMSSQYEIVGDRIPECQRRNSLH